MDGLQVWFDCIYLYICLYIFSAVCLHFNRSLFSDLYNWTGPNLTSTRSWMYQDWLFWWTSLSRVSIIQFYSILKMIFQKYFYLNIRMCAVINHCHSYEWILNNDDNDIFGETWCAVEGYGMCYCCDCEWFHEKITSNKW